MAHLHINLICCTKSAPILLMHVSLLLALLSGAGLATLARLKWDPSTYLTLRVLLSTEYRVLSGVLCFGTFLLIALAHLATIAFNIRGPKHANVRKTMFFTYSALMSILIFVELVTVIWLSVRVYNWLQTEEARHVIEALRALQDVGSILTGLIGLLAKFVGAFEVIRDSIDEITGDIPVNLQIAIAFVIFTAILQPLAVLLALNAAFTYKNKQTQSGSQIVSSIRYKETERKPRTAAISTDKREFKLRDVYLSKLQK